MAPGPGGDDKRPPVDPLLERGLGIDHFIIVTEDLAEASRDFREKLGFAVRPGGRHPSGTENSVILFPERQYVELLALQERPSDHPDAAELRRFLRNGEGAVLVGIRVPSSKAIVAHLSEKGIRSEGPTPGTVAYPGIDEPPPTFWTSVALKTGRMVVDDTVFFIEYVQGAYGEFRARHPELPARGSAPPNHPNSALGDLRPWLAVTHLGEAVKVYEALGFPAVRRTKFGRLKGNAVELRVGAGSLLLIESSSSEGPVRGFLEQRDAECGWMGISLGVHSLESTLGAIQRDLAARLKPRKGLFGRSILLPPELAHGIWLELFER